MKVASVASRPAGNLQPATLRAVQQQISALPGGAVCSGSVRMLGVFCLLLILMQVSASVCERMKTE